MSFTEHQPTARVIAILEVLASNREGMSLSEIARAIDSSKGTISPVIHTLAKRKLIFANKETQKYQIGISAYCIGASYAENMDVIDYIRSVMKDIVEQSSEICQMGILDGNQVLYVAKVDSDESIRIISHVGSRIPASCTALGKAILSNFSLEEIKALYPDGLPALTQHSITDFSILEKQLEVVRKTKIAFENGESNDHSNCLAVPLSKDNKVISAISISIPAYRHTEEKTQLITELLFDAQKKVELYFRSHDIDFDNLLLQ